MDRFLIIQTAFIGDVILATPVLEKLHAHYPHARIDILVRQDSEPLLRNHPFLNHVFTWHKKADKYTNFLKLIQQIRKERYDCVVNLHRFMSSGLITTLARASTTLGFAKNPLSFFYTHRATHQIGDGTHEVERNLSVISPLVETSFTKPRLYPSAGDYETVAHYRTSPYICIAPASVWYTKQLPPAKWIALVNQLPSD